MKSLNHLIVFFLVILFSCSQDKEIKPASIKIKNVIIVLIDGPRYSETYGDTLHQYIPNQVSIASSGVVCTSFYNDGVTNTFNGHVALLTGVYENLNNSGMEAPTYPTVFQQFLKKSGNDSTKAWIVSSKDKLQELNSCKDSDYCYRYKPKTDCGINGLFTGYREDSVTYNHAINVMRRYHPNLILISFKEPDASAHAGDWQGYLDGIKNTDEYARKIFDFIQSSQYYKNSTALFITNDHGRHLDSIANGFVSHGDGCEGCRHINLFAYGPCFKNGFSCSTYYDQNDLATTIGHLLHFDMPYSNGDIMYEILN